jgi:general secretion pathway protein F
MDVAAKLVTILPIKYAVQKAKLKVQEGGSISKSLKSTSYFSPMAIHLIASGESSGSIEEMLNHAALTQDDEVKRLIETSLTLFEPLIILIMGAVILFIVLATLLPIFTMDQLVG